MEDSEFKAIGVDGCRSGWFYVVLSPSRRPDWGVAEKLEELLPDVGGSDRIFVDIPIGLLTDQSARACDIEARCKLRKRTILPEGTKLPSRTSCVFSTPVRAALGAENYEDAKRQNQEACGIKRKFRAILKLRRIFCPSPATGCGGSGPFFRLQDVSMHSSPYCDILPFLKDFSCDTRYPCSSMSSPTATRGPRS